MAPWDDSTAKDPTAVRLPSLVVCWPGIYFCGHRHAGCGASRAAHNAIFDSRRCLLYPLVRALACVAVKQSHVRAADSGMGAGSLHSAACKDGCISIMALVGGSSVAFALSSTGARLAATGLIAVGLIAVAIIPTCAMPPKDNE